ncbi:LTA synthase family protein [Vagococcus sp.]|uniref:LTA synthase family protein n=1 Tax=Vagococcus sp. TaxID=1933889 RepID=UPI002FC710A0
MVSKLKAIAKKMWFKLLISVIIVLASNYYLQLTQNNWSFSLATKFAFSWHTEKFLLGALVLLVIDVFIISIAGSFLVGNSFYLLGIILLGIANAMKMSLRMEPIYPDDLKMIIEWTMLKDILGNPLFFVFILTVLGLIFWLAFSFYRSLKLSLTKQKVRVVTLLVTSMLLVYISNFNQPNNLLRKAYDKTALWIPYSQKMNYYNTGFMGGFLFNLKVEGMEKPEHYSKAEINKIMTHYQEEADKKNQKKSTEEQPDIVYIMSESFSDPSKLEGVHVTPDPLKDYRDVASESILSGQMLSQNYGGGTANIEFEALTGFSMALLNPQMTTPYTMMLPKKENFPSMVSTLKSQDYKTTAIHPYNTSMYKRKDVYKVFGFDQFLDEKTMKNKEKLSKEGFISDKSAFKEVQQVLKESKEPQFIHLVTMQTHMPYTNKYSDSKYQVKELDNDVNIVNYAQDIAYTSEALKGFIEETKTNDRPILICFWGDHLPSIYPDSVIDENDKVTTHLTEYFVYDSQDTSPTLKQVISPFYFPSVVSQTAGVKATGFSMLLEEMHYLLPAFENEMYFYNQTWKKEITLSKEDQAIFDDYQMIQYDIVSGQQYSQHFFK